MHHEDYLTSSDDHALCGITFEGPTRLDRAARPVAVCPDCEARLIEYHLVWWRDKALAALAENDELRIKNRELAASAEDRSAARAAPRPERQRAPQGASPAGHTDAQPGSLLDQARTELLELCQQFDGAVPYRRVKTTMQAFSDKLDSDDRARLAQQIGNDGSLLRWSTTEVQKHGWSVTDNPVQASPEEMWDYWTRDAHQTPKPSRWRMARSRTRDSR
ncbi:hypothetical protein [Mycolicibacterium holsaticum]|uniref:hypothetical protein n=1 Tax=Mycolicibacterium holsaticum TaxID=152142 RepID=UPI001C7CECFD|nr:hypothetical protein [Mycolicibacterium holsaticum]MDA4107512.1 hypothetical protein [Mycolicibacterium holsaticum DSM 44478 = JCM 12374]QZA11178.1 hypothetical protein K3U96_18270 [Mycolicibacterium holsaticum DSM 44478 = JCM 12374]UNC11328.1 hypothetical protein H5U41_08560 [Mycolicibacterium holsaticum DSM 44478 = JCM 12374]